MQEQHYYTIEEADTLLQEIDANMRQTHRLIKRLIGNGMDEEDVYECIDDCLEEEESIEEYEFLAENPAAKQAMNKILRLINDILDHDVHIQDLDLGLVDFPSWFQGREVHLCHKLGEDRIRHWHEVDSGFRGRQPIFEIDVMMDE
ncbi:MAG: DUF2203 domain-containing protein [Nanoarchaeota archaeon]